jgi:septal ring factor EnvC (AmiA/AmiB activator)
MSCWVCDAANGTCEHENGNVLTPELALEIERYWFAEAEQEIKRLKAELKITERKLETARNDGIQCGDLAAKRFERIKELEKELDEEEKEHLLALRNLDKALTEVDVWKRQAEAWQKRGWELGKEIDVIEDFARRGVRLVYRFKMDNSDRCAPWLDGETFSYTMADQLETDWNAFLNERSKKELGET